MPAKGAVATGNPLTAFLELRRSLRRAPLGDGGRDTCRALSDALDEAIAASLPRGLADELAVVAVGGYGRREQSLFSDVDVMLLHSGADLATATRALLYPLWDANLKVGHSARTVAECTVAAKESFETLTALLSTRLIAGNGKLVGDLEAALAGMLAGRPLTSRLAAAERERRAVHNYPLMAADLKNGRGGLRTFQSFWWERRRAELVGLPLPHNSTREEQRAHRALLAVRNALHATAGKALDEFVPDLRDGAAKWLSSDSWDVSERVTKSLRTGDQLAMERWPDLNIERAAGSRWRRRRRRSLRSHGSPERPLARARAAAERPEGLVMDRVDQAAIAAWGSHDWTGADRRDLIGLLALGSRGRSAMGWLHRLGWVDANLPEIAHTIAAPQLAPFHEHPVDTHLWRTVDEMRALVSGGDPWYTSIAQEVANPDLLLLGSFLHDVGKAHGGDHSTVGADLAGSLCRRIGFTELAEPVAALVQNHLLLADTATKRDTSDRRVLAEVADRCHDLQRLQALYLLTVADAKATGRTMWTDWKATLLKNLYVGLVGVIEPEPGRVARAQRLQSIARFAATAEDRAAAHVDAMPPGYLEGHSDDEIAAHLRLAAGLTRRESAVQILGAPDAADRMVVVGIDRPGLLGAIAGVLTIHNLEILDARLQARADGVACDTFHIRHTLPDVPMSPVATIEADLSAALRGTLEVASLAAEKAAPYRSRGRRHLVVRAPPDPTLRYTAIEVRCDDRPGVLSDIVQELYAAGLDIRAARIDTRGDEARDLFYVLDRNGEPIRDVNELAPLIAGLRSSLRRRLY